MSDSELQGSQGPRGVTGVFDELLKRPVATLRRVRTDGRLHQTWILAGGALLAFVLYGLAAGSFQGGPQMVVAAWKAPVIVLLSALLCAPSLFVFASLLGASMTPRTLFTVLVGFCTFLGVLLLGLVPIAWLFAASSRSLVFVTWLHVLLWLGAVALAGRYLRTVLAEAGGRGVIVPWLLLFTVVSFQVVTLMRPVLWRAPSEPLFVSRTEKLSFFEHLGRTYEFDNPNRHHFPTGRRQWHGFLKPNGLVRLIRRAPESRACCDTSPTMPSPSRRRRPTRRSCGRRTWGQARPHPAAGATRAPAMWPDRETSHG